MTDEERIDRIEDDEEWLNAALDNYEAGLDSAELDFYRRRIRSAVRGALRLEELVKDNIVLAAFALGGEYAEVNVDAAIGLARKEGVTVTRNEDGNHLDVQMNIAPREAIRRTAIPRLLTRRHAPRPRTAPLRRDSRRHPRSRRRTRSVARARSPGHLSGDDDPSPPSDLAGTVARAA
ncbi:MAG: hypothetical protein M3Q31_05565 [Actinomycetota bacterium]|nr:hypothetical protein [Actinomycetota bacterium]